MKNKKEKFIKNIGFYIIFLLTFNLYSAKYSVSVNVAQDWGVLPHFWKCFGTGHYGLFFSHPELKDHLKIAVKELGMNRIRSHGFLHDDIGIYHEINGTPSYNFAKADSIIDFLLSLGIRPVMEFGSMPKDLASDPNRTTFAWKQIISPPKDWNKWQNLIKEFVNHYKNKYGETEISKWYFEVWNEPELDGFWSGTEQQYYQLYSNAVTGAKAAYSNAKIGGPTPSGPWAFNRITNLLNYCKSNNVPIDCIFFHTWSIDDSRNGYFQALDIGNQYNPNLEYIDTEWGPTYKFHLQWQAQENTRGSCCAADVVCSIARRCVTEKKKFPTAYSWWVVSDIFEEAGWDGYRQVPINTGNMGLISREGIYKPAFNVFKMLNMMGNHQISIDVSPNATTNTVNGMATVNSENNSIQVMLYNNKYNGENQQYPPSGKDTVTLTISNLKPGLYDYECYLVDGNHSNAYSAWLSMGMPTLAQMTNSQWNTLRTEMLLDTVESQKDLNVPNNFSKTYILQQEGVMMIVFKPKTTTKINESYLNKISPQDISIIKNNNAEIIISSLDNYNQFNNEITIMSIDGKIVFNKKLEAKKCLISTKNIANGLYFMKIKTSNGIVVKNFLIK